MKSNHASSKMLFFYRREIRGRSSLEFVISSAFSAMMALQKSKDLYNEMQCLLLPENEVFHYFLNGCLPKEVVVSVRVMK